MINRIITSVSEIENNGIIKSFARKNSLHVNPFDPKTVENEKGLFFLSESDAAICLDKSKRKQNLFLLSTIDFKNKAAFNAVNNILILRENLDYFVKLDGCQKKILLEAFLSRSSEKNSLLTSAESVLIKKIKSRFNQLYIKII